MLNLLKNITGIYLSQGGKLTRLEPVYQGMPVQMTPLVPMVREVSPTLSAGTSPSSLLTLTTGQYSGTGPIWVLGIVSLNGTELFRYTEKGAILTFVPDADGLLLIEERASQGSNVQVFTLDRTIVQP